MKKKIYSFEKIARLGTPGKKISNCKNLSVNLSDKKFKEFESAGTCTFFIELAPSVIFKLYYIDYVEVIT